MAFCLAGGGGRSKLYDRGIVREHTNIENVVLEREVTTNKIAGALLKEIATVSKVDLFVHEALKDAVFVGHLVTD